MYVIGEAEHLSTYLPVYLCKHVIFQELCS